MLAKVVSGGKLFDESVVVEGHPYQFDLSVTQDNKLTINVDNNNKPGNVLMVFWIK